MITTRVVPALLPGHHRPITQLPVTITNDFADPLGADLTTSIPNRSRLQKGKSPQSDNSFHSDYLTTCWTHVARAGSKAPTIRLVRASMALRRHAPRAVLASNSTRARSAFCATFVTVQLDPPHLFTSVSLGGLAYIPPFI